MKTLELFRDNVYLKEFSATINDVVTEGDLHFIVLDRTAFFPEGGGQSSDIGYIGDLKVTNVFRRDGSIFHKVEAGASCSDAIKGAECMCSIDWEHRFDNMQRHLGEHILSGAFYRLFGATNKGFHMGDDYMTIDMLLDDESISNSESIDNGGSRSGRTRNSSQNGSDQCGSQNSSANRGSSHKGSDRHGSDPDAEEGSKYLTWDMAMAAQLEANKVIWKDSPVTTTYFDNLEDAEGVPVRKPLNIEEDISVVTVGDADAPDDCVACCGTHPSTAGQVGSIKIFKIEPNKGMTRIYFDAGKRALCDHDKKHDIITELGHRYSAGADDLIEKIEIQAQKAAQVRDKLHDLREFVKGTRTKEILAALSGGAPGVPNEPSGAFSGGAPGVPNEPSGSLSGGAPGSSGGAAGSVYDGIHGAPNDTVLSFCFDELTLDDLRGIGKTLQPKGGESLIPAGKLLALCDKHENTVLLYSQGGSDNSSKSSKKKKKKNKGNAPDAGPSAGTQSGSPGAPAGTQAGSPGTAADIQAGSPGTTAGTQSGAPAGAAAAGHGRSGSGTYTGIIDCNKLIKDNAEVFGGRGGGRPESAQARFARFEDMEMFLMAVRNLLRP